MAALWRQRGRVGQGEHSKKSHGFRFEKLQQAEKRHGVSNLEEQNNQGGRRKKKIKRGEMDVSTPLFAIKDVGKTRSHGAALPQNDEG